ncbi:hypothetical protein [Aureibaculum conchae]|uniref:hypothetical protein n=1 Tax=Aureibaculum sp. 2308TA14-22 TaxID=3108392 RepID=UPI0033921D7F
MKNLEMRTIFNLLILIKTVQKIFITKMSNIRISYERAMVNTVPKSGQPLFRYLTKIWTSYGPALVSKDKHYKTGINNTNRAKLEKRKKQAIFLKVFIKFFKKWKMSNRYKFYGIKVFKTEKAVDQNLDKLKTASSSKMATTFLEIIFFKNYLLLFLIALYPDDFSLNCSCSFSMSTLTFRSTTLA